jgi:predicted Zn-dependent protease
VGILNRARLLAPYEVSIALDLAEAVVRMHHGAEAIPLLERTRVLDPKRAEPDCLLGRAYEQTGDLVKEQAALDACLKLGPPPTFQTLAAQRLKDIRK